MGRKDLERLVGKLLSMHLTVEGAVSPLLHIQRALTQGGMNQLWMLPAFYREIVDWRALALLAAARPMHLAEIVCREPTHLGLCDASGVGVEGVWLFPAQTGHNLVWWHP